MEKINELYSTMKNKLGHSLACEVLANSILKNDKYNDIFNDDYEFSTRSVLADLRQLSARGNRRKFSKIAKLGKIGVNYNKVIENYSFSFVEKRTRQLNVDKLTSEVKRIEYCNNTGTIETVTTLKPIAKRDTASILGAKIRIMAEFQAVDNNELVWKKAEYSDILRQYELSLSDKQLAGLTVCLMAYSDGADNLQRAVDRASYVSTARLAKKAGVSVTDLLEAHLRACA